jgi:hypothetical protein
MALVCVLASTVHADPLESAAQALVDSGLREWERGDLPAARALFAHARDVLPDKPNPYRLLALIDSKLGHCAAAVLEAERFLALTPPDDRRRGEIVAVRESCTAAPAKMNMSVNVNPAPTAIPSHASPRRGLRIAAITTLVLGTASAVVGGVLWGTLQKNAFEAGLPLTTLGGVSLAISIPLFVVAYGR